MAGCAARTDRSAALGQDRRSGPQSHPFRGRLAIGLTSLLYRRRDAWGAMADAAFTTVTEVLHRPRHGVHPSAGWRHSRGTYKVCERGMDLATATRDLGRCNGSTDLVYIRKQSLSGSEVYSHRSQPLTTTQPEQPSEGESHDDFRKHSP